MLLYVGKRLVGAVPLIFVILIVNFVFIHLAPGDAVSYFIGAGTGVTEEYVQGLRVELGLDRPFAEQLVRYLNGVCKGNLGYSFIYQQPVLRLIMQRMPLTLLLISGAMVIASMTGVTMGVFVSLHRGSFFDFAVSAAALAGYSIPVFWLAQILILIFALKLGWFPTGGISSLKGNWTLFDFLLHLTLPVVSLSIMQLAMVLRMTRASMLEVLGLDYVTTARAKGLKERVVIYRHVTRNALLPVVTVVTMNFSALLSGSVLIETVYSWPGLGRLLFESVLRRDYPIIMGLLVVMSIGVILINLVTDISYMFLDPRIVYK